MAVHGSLVKYVNLRIAHAPGMPGTFSPPPRVSDPDMHHGTCVAHVPRCMLGSLTSGFIWSWGREKCSRHTRRMRNLQFHLSGKRPMACLSESSGHQQPWYQLRRINRSLSSTKAVFNNLYHFSFLDQIYHDKRIYGLYCILVVIMAAISITMRVHS